MKYDEKLIVFIVTIGVLNNPVYKKRLWLAARNMNISRREWPNVIADAIYNFDGIILLSNGIRWPIPDVDKVLGDPRWFSYYFEEDEKGDPHRDVIMLERLRLIDLFFKIKHPEIARHFSK
ncbi:hypothetical protein [Nitrosomonas europaea]|uniref:Uncharacterized protein n=1 Tax=Nitrosomonas europaea (strain ATCC 19718 / CIP 103999 / KCTC 2705 / NBRC 14298) TaxID=228410 RepID=Q82XL6_NITEU|nr:hypothetical protein [Nitrosomonas europaea]CAD84153.1 hypothetical protein NE0242 [Nitrosomonas europaea ATCC 19718]SDW97490.1 hypothetical protein SAMN05216310_1663 [Nitrosomonas europaea]SET50356.1 hypothetical protein SAMN05216309_1673 [Nitrosomonas europaea]SKA06777.1 hypothetical protein SAMN02745113_02628 [Nitrosomonas europaea]